MKLTAQDLPTLLKRMEKGDIHVYHEGYLAFNANPKLVSGAPIRQLASAVYKAYLDGEVTLVQRRRGFMHYEYWMIKR